MWSSALLWVGCWLSLNTTAPLQHYWYLDPTASSSLNTKYSLPCTWMQKFTPLILQMNTNIDAWRYTPTACNYRMHIHNLKQAYAHGCLSIGKRIHHHTCIKIQEYTKMFTIHIHLHTRLRIYYACMSLGINNTNLTVNNCFKGTWKVVILRSQIVTAFYQTSILVRENAIKHEKANMETTSA